MLPYAEATARPRSYWEFWLLAGLSLLGLFPSADPGVIQSFGFVANHPTWYSWITCQFLHGGLMHFLGNFWMLWIFGPTVAWQLGPLFIPFYLLGGGVAALACLGLDASSAVPMIGASGAISAVMGYYMVVFPRSRLKVLLEGIILPWSVDISAFAFIILFLGTEASAWFRVSQGYDDGVAHLAHLAGLGLGVFVGLCDQKAPALGVREGATDSGPIARAEDEGEEEIAVQSYAAKIEEDVGFRLDDARELKMAGKLRELGYDALATAVLRRLAADAADRSVAARAASTLAGLEQSEPAELPELPALGAVRLVDRFSVSTAGIGADGGDPIAWADCLLVAAYGLRQERLKEEDGVLDIRLSGTRAAYGEAKAVEPVIELVVRRPWRRLRWAPDPADQPGGLVLDLYFQAAGAILANVIGSSVSEALIHALHRRIPPRCVFDDETSAAIYVHRQAQLALAKRKAPFV